MTVQSATELEEIAHRAIALESEAADLVNQLTGIIRQAWQMHQNSDDRSMARWAAAWKQARASCTGYSLAASVRKAIVQELTQDGMSSRAMAAALGITQSTANRDARSSGESSDSVTGPEKRQQRKMAASVMEDDVPDGIGDRLAEVARLPRTRRMYERAEMAISGLPGVAGGQLKRLLDGIAEMVEGDNPKRGTLNCLDAISELAAQLQTKN
ncbi:hypothetical protein [Streptomyces sp. BPTC-684]|uniref:hypothetical protein n=1 Tax=Streptomyces sp. BPTC-684 TaxID=3043734 RepID=UPI0024B248FE|nr:hypothetical protein [Streptomyces sp. BPTC-684]WHM35630.1 hypothetical protein QIY60_01035 [Streptomyces sp. BPTC-684]